MSRYKIDTPSRTIIFGFDPALGPFWEEWVDYESDQDEPILDLSYRMGRDGSIDCHGVAARLVELEELGELPETLTDYGTGKTWSSHAILQFAMGDLEF